MVNEKGLKRRGIVALVLISVLTVLSLVVPCSSRSWSGMWRDLPESRDYLGEGVV